jgi:hypothetical protein
VRVGPHRPADGTAPYIPERRVVAIGPDNIFEKIRIEIVKLDFHAGQRIGRDRHFPVAMPVPCRSAKRRSPHHAQPTTQGELSGAYLSHTPAGFWKMPIEGSAAPSKLNRVRLTFGEPMFAPGSHGTPGIQSGAQ